MGSSARVNWPWPSVDLVSRSLKVREVSSIGQTRAVKITAPALRADEVEVEN